MRRIAKSNAPFTLAARIADDARLGRGEVLEMAQRQRRRTNEQFPF
jgi:hypothetical protein